VKLSVYKDGQKIQDFEFGPEQKSIKLGRDKSSTLLLDHKRVSRTHAEISSVDGIFKIQKRSDYDALYLNGDSIESAELRSGDQISIPPFAITVIYERAHTIHIGSSASSPETLTAAAPEIDLALGDNVSEVAPVEDEATKDFSPNLEEFSFSEEKPASAPAEQDPLSFSDGGDFSNNEENQSFNDDSSLVENNEFAMEESEGDKTSVLTGFANYRLEIHGEFAPFDDYTLEEGETLIGRDPTKAKIVLKDPEVSSLHAKIFKKKALCTIEDLQSGNGTLLNGKRINKASLENGDEIVIGSTTFTVKVLSSLLENEKERLMPVEANQEIEVEEIVEVLNDDSVSSGEGFGEFGKSAPEEKSILKNPEKRKKLIYGVVVVLLGFLLFSEDEDPKKKNAVKKDEKKNYLIETEATPGASKDPNKKELTPEDYEYLEPRYLNAKNLFDNGRYDEALRELENVFRRTDQYKNARQLEELSKQGLAKLEEIERKKREEIEDRKRKIKVQELLKKASDAVDKKEILLAENLFGQISKLDPENTEVESLRSSLENWKRDEEAKKLAEAAKIAERERKTKQFQDAKAYYNRGEWYNSVNKLEAFMRIKGMDEDFLREAQQLLNESKAKLKDLVDPLVGKARSLKESQDLKGVYQAYVEVLKFDPSNEEALNEIAKIRDELINRAKTIYREAIIAESMSLFDEAKDKFKEVMQISPEDSDYHKKAKDKLKQYLE
jgi:pSer/pThr/pTyr-binding forkhead associated (FHA) protein